MKNKKLFTVLFLFLILTMAAISCVPEDFTKNELLETAKNSGITNAVAERIKEYGVKDLFPPTIVMVISVLIPIFAVIGFFLVLYVFISLYHKKVMAMIEKGTYSPRPVNIRWDLICLLIGLIFIFIGPGISLTVSAFFGIRMWSLATGSIPLLMGVAFLIFYKFLKKQKNVK
jgi:hypothetical protein